MGTMFYTWAKHIEGQQAAAAKGASALPTHGSGRPEPTRSPSTSSSSSTLLNSDDDEDDELLAAYDKDGKSLSSLSYPLKSTNKSKSKRDVEWSAGGGRMGERERRARLATVKEQEQESAEDGEVLFDAEKADERV